MSKDLTEPVISPEEAEEKSTRAMDPELRAMGQILRIMDDIDAAARVRALAWLNARFTAAPVNTDPQDRR